MVSYQYSLVTLSLKRTVLKYSTSKYTVTLNPGWASLNVIENHTIQSGTHDFLLTFHSNHRPISHRFRDKRRCPSKITRKLPIFPTPVYLTPPLKVFPWNFVSAQGSQETRVMMLSDGRKLFQIGLAYLISSLFDTIPACDGQPTSQPVSQPARHGAVASTALPASRR